MDTKVYSALTDLGFHSAEMRTLAGRLAEACAREDLETAKDVAQALQEYADEFNGLYVKLLSTCGGISIPDGTRSESSSV
jgi:hypothetical protein